MLPVLVMNRTRLPEPVPPDHPRPAARPEGAKPRSVGGTGGISRGPYCADGRPGRSAACRCLSRGSQRRRTRMMRRLIAGFSARAMSTSNCNGIASAGRGTGGLTGLCDLADGARLARSWQPTASLYAEAWGRDVHDVFTCLRHHTHLDAAGALLSSNAERRVKSPREMARCFSDLPEAIDSTRSGSPTGSTSRWRILAIRIPRFSRAGGNDDGASPERADLSRGARPVRLAPLDRGAGRQLDKELGAHQPPSLRRLLPHRRRHRQLCARRTTFSSRAAAARPTARSAIALGITAVDPIGGDLLLRALS